MTDTEEEVRDVDVSSSTYRLWLLAGRPPFYWFIGLSTLEQEQLGQIGADYTSDIVEAFGQWIVGPTDEPQQSQEDMVKSLAGQAAAAFMADLKGRLGEPDQSQQRPSRPRTMAGFGERREILQQEESRRKGAGKSFLGRRPDGIEPKETTDELVPDDPADQSPAGGASLEPGVR